MGNDASVSAPYMDESILVAPRTDYDQAISRIVRASPLGLTLLTRTFGSSTTQRNGNVDEFGTAAGRLDVVSGGHAVISL